MTAPSLLISPDRYKAGKLYSQLPQSGAGDFSVVRNTVANRVNDAGVLVSEAANVPRIDFGVSSCPALLVEPAATNLLLRSEEFDNAYWTKTDCSVTANTGIAPNGTTTMDTFTSSSAAAEVTRSGLSLVSGTSYTLSYFIQNINYLAGETIRIVLSNGIDSEVRAVFNIVAGTAFVTSSGSNLTSGRAAVTELPNGIFRVSISATSAISSSSASCSFLMQVASRSLRAWGAQLETGSVATSYIPTVATTQTRNADAISLTGASSLIGQTQGTIYAEVDIRNMAKETHIIRLDDGTSTNVLTLRTLTGNVVRTAIIAPTTSGTLNISSATFTAGTIKIAFAYQSGNIALSVNGAGALTANGTFSFGATLSRIFLGSNDGTSFLNDRIRAAAIYTSRLSNAELAQLTTL